VREKLTGYSPRFFRYFTKKQLEKLILDGNFIIHELYTYTKEDKKLDRKLDWIVIFAKKAKNQFN